MKYYWEFALSKCTFCFEIGREVSRSVDGVKVFYRGPCGRRLGNFSELHRYLQETECSLSIDDFCFDKEVDTMREFVAGRTLYTIKVMYAKCVL